MCSSSRAWLFLNAAYEDAINLALQYGVALVRLESDSCHPAAVRLIAKDMRERLSWWRHAIADTPWYVQYYVETFKLYDVYDFGADWIAAHTSFDGLRPALELIDPPDMAPMLIRATSYART